MDDFLNLQFEPATRRSECSRCRRPSTVCLCPFLPNKPINVKSSVYIIQHPREEKRPVRTDYLVKGCLPVNKCTVFRGRRFSPKRYPELDAVCSSPNALILYPGPNAVNISDVPQLPDGVDGYNLIVVDGTWAQAKCIFASNELLKKPLQVQLCNMGPSEFVIRMQPTPDSLSTVESVAMALSVLERRLDIKEVMLTALRGLCKHQLDCGAVMHHTREYRNESRPKTAAKEEDESER